jgi:hypothetical protein
MPPEVLGELERATLTTDIMNIVALVEQFRVQHPALADMLMKLADNFEYTTLKPPKHFDDLWIADWERRNSL